MSLSDLSEPSFGPIGKVVYERSYSRVKEDGTHENWGETVARVVEGNIDFVKEEVGEDEKEKLFDLIYNFKMLPAGRHLWATGAPNGKQFINNCHTSYWDPEHFGDHFTFLFARLLEGGGVGNSFSDKYFDYNSIPKELDLHFVCDKTHDDHNDLGKYLSDRFSSEWAGSLAIDDSREGWVEALDTMFSYHMNGEQGPLVFDVSQIRPKGSKLKSFGGTASGPEALVIMLFEINKLLNSYVGQEPDWKLALKIDHEIAKAVVAGGNRRSSMLASKSWEDEDILEFINIKNTDNNLDLWTMNISVELTSDFWWAYRRGNERCEEILEAISVGMLRDGEPGILNKTKMQEGEVDEIFSTNPCLTGDTKVMVAGKAPVTIKQLAEEGKDVPVYCATPSGKTTISMMRNPRLTGKHKPVYKVTFKDGNHIDITENHKFILTNGKKCECKNLKVGDTITTLTRFWHSDQAWLEGFHGVEKEQSFFKEFDEEKARLSKKFIDGKPYVIKCCENCGNRFIKRWEAREVSFCSDKCAVQKSEEINLLYNFWGEAREIEFYNYKVKSVEFIGYQDVYNGTVDEYHNFYCGCFEEAKSHKSSYKSILCQQCGEIPLPFAGSCCLGSINCAAFKNDLPGMKEAFRLMARFLIRATFSDINDPLMKARTKRDRRIGVGIFGFHDWLLKNGCRYTEFPYNEKMQNILKDMADEVEEASREYARQLRIPEPIKTRCIAPTGTTSLLCGVSSGMQPILYKYFIRRMRFSLLDPRKKEQLKDLEELGAEVEDDVYASDTKVAEFHCCATIVREVDKSLVEDSLDIEPEDVLAVQATLQSCWADNAIACTVNVDQTDLERVKRAIITYAPQLKGMTLFPRLTENRPQLPYERITEEEFEAMDKGFDSSGLAECKGNSCGLVKTPE